MAACPAAVATARGVREWEAVPRTSNGGKRPQFFWDSLMRKIVLVDAFRITAKAVTVGKERAGMLNAESTRR